MTRSKHVQWCKDRALEYIKAGDLQGAFASMSSDITNHPETQQHATTNQLGMMQLMGGMLDTAEKMEKWITGYN